MAVQPAAPTTGLPPTQQVDYSAFIKAIQAAPNYAGLDKTATARAGQQTDLTVQGLRGEQDRINRQAAVRAQQIDAATLAAANQLTGLHLADRLGSSLRSSAHDLAGLASGYSGQLQQTVGDAGDELARHLAGLGAPGGVPSTAAQAGNVLYGLGGTLPASTLLTDAPFVEAAARALPGETLGYGRQQAAGALGQGAERAGALDPQITAAYAHLPALQRSILSDLQSQASKARQDAIANTFKALSLQQQGFTAEATRAYRDAQLAAEDARAKETAAHNAALEAAATTRNDLSQQGVDLTRKRFNNDVTKYNNSRLPTFNATNSRANGYATDQYGNPIVGKDGRKVTLPGFKTDPKTGATVRVATPSASSSATNNRQLFKDATTLTKQLSTPSKPEYYQGQPVAGSGRPASSYSDALAQVTALGPSTPQWHKKATQIVNARYGSPQTIAAKAISDARSQGLHLTEIIGTLLHQSDGLPMSFYLAALARAYNRPVGSLAKIVQDVQAAIDAGTYGA